MKTKREQRADVVRAMKDGGYFDSIMQASQDLQRVKEYLLAFAGGAEAPHDRLQYPDYPCFPGLRNLPLHSVRDVPGAAILEQSFTTIHSEWRTLSEGDYLQYAPEAMNHLWAVHLMQYMGICFEEVTGRFPQTHSLLRRLPRACLDYPWGDALISVHARDSHLKPHCSVDNLRVRCHLGIQVPTGCAIRVGGETRTWHEGKALLFEDSFEHEVWNQGDTKRAILIADFWHPDLTDIEIEALTAGFRKSDVRSLFLFNRLQFARDVPDVYIRHLHHQMASQDNDAVFRRYWR